MQRQVQHDGRGSAPGRGHMSQLDALRAFAVLAVVFQHATDVRLPVLRDLGFYGVDLFFVLSGFLITGILLRAGDDAARAGASTGGVIRAFYARRFLRIFPIYYLILIVGAAIGIRDIRTTFGWDVSYLANYYFAIHRTWRSAAVPLWSLAVEEQFYLVWPLLVLFAPRRRLPALLAALIVTAPLVRLGLALATGSEPATLTPTLACVDALGLGALLAFLWSLGSAGEALRLRWGRIALAIGLALIVLENLLGDGQVGTVARLALDRSAVALVGFWLVDRAAVGFDGTAARVLGWRPLLWVGTISYGIYLMHNFVAASAALAQRATGFRSHFPAHHGLSWLVYDLSVTLAVASVSWLLFERPINALKRNFPYVARGSRAAGALEVAT
jgi:peptidoglycan/LPS O-acetylase OafA/YrhL